MGLFDSPFSDKGNPFSSPSPSPSPASPSPSSPSPSPLSKLPNLTDLSGLSGLSGLSDLSGVDASGSVWMGVAQWIGVSLIAGIIVALIFISSQNLVFLSSPKNLSTIPINAKAPPYTPGIPPGKSPTMMNKVLYGYGPPYSFSHHPTVFPFIPCNFSFLRNFFGLKSWIGNTLAKTWINSRKLLKVVLGGIHGLPKWIEMIFAFIFIILMIAFTPIIGIVFTLMASFHSNVGWSILGIIPLIILSVIVSIIQVIMLLYYLFISPMTTPEGRQFVGGQVQKHRKHLRLIYTLLIVLLSPLYIPPMYTVGMIIGVILFGF